MEKKEIINSIAIKLSSETGVDMQKIHDILVMELYKFSIVEIESTEVSIAPENSTDSLFKYFAIGKLGSNKSEETINQYKRVVYQLCCFVNKELYEITSEDVQYYLVMYKKMYKVKSSTMESKRLYLSSVFSYLYKHHKIKDNPMNLIEPIHHKQCVKFPLSDEEIERIRVACGNDKREIAIVDFFLNTGVRVSELCNIELSDVDFINNKCKVLGKGNKERFVYFSGKCKVRLQEYINTRKDIICHNGGLSYPAGTKLFVSNDVKCHPMHKSGISFIIKKLGKVANIQRLHCHLFRATFATNLAKRGVDINIIAHALGHSNLNTISRYVLLTDEQVDMSLKNAGIA